MNKKAKYGMIGALVFGFYFFFVHPLVVNKYAKKSMIKGVVLNTEWYNSSIGFSTKGAKGYFKQKVEYSFIYKGKKYNRSFNNGPDIGALFDGDSILIEFKNNHDKDSKIVSKFKTQRKKFKSVSSANVKKINFNFLNGIWAENLDENSLFKITGDSITYTDSFETYYISMKADTILIDYRDWIYRGLVTQLTEEELVIEDIDDKENLKLIRFK